MPSRLAAAGFAHSITLLFAEDDQGVRHGVGGLAEAAGETDLALAPLAVALLVLGDAAVDLAPQPGREGRDQPVLAADQVG